MIEVLGWIVGCTAVVCMVWAVFRWVERDPNGKPPPSPRPRPERMDLTDEERTNQIKELDSWMRSG